MVLGIAEGGENGFTGKLDAKERMSEAENGKGGLVAVMEPTGKHAPNRDGEGAKANANADTPMTVQEIQTYAPHVAEGLKRLREEMEGVKGDQHYEPSMGELQSQVAIFKDVGDMILEAEGKEFIIDQKNGDLVRYLICYLNRWQNPLRFYAQKIAGEDGKKASLDKPIFLMGEKGVGKTLHMQIAAKFAQVLGLRSREFLNTSASELLNYMRVRGNLDYYTYNIGKAEMRAGRLGSARPWGVCLHDLGLELDASNKQRIYGTDLIAVLNDFLMARYELYQNHGLMTHITSNLTLAQFSKAYPPRVKDRFKAYNYLTITGRSRR